MEHRAAGGPVGRGRPYVVGENGPEMFIPDQSGTIAPNGGGGIDYERLAAALRNQPMRLVLGSAEVDVVVEELETHRLAARRRLI